MSWLRNSGDALEKPGLRGVCEQRFVDIVKQLREAQKGAVGKLVLIVDDTTEHIIKATLPMDSTLFLRQDVDIALMQKIEDERRGCPLDALYFLSPDESSIRMLLEDLSGVDPSEDPPGAPAARGASRSEVQQGARHMYRAFHVVVSHKLPRDFISAIRAHPGKAQIKTLIEANFPLAPFDSRSFTFGDRYSLPRVLSNTLKERELAETASKLASVCSTLGARPVVRYDACSVRRGGFAEALATQVVQRLDELDDRMPLCMDPGQRGCVDPGSFTLLIVDRLVDLPVALGYDMGYEALVYDILGGVSVDVREQCFIDKSGNDEDPRRTPLCDGMEKDLWASFRHRPIWEVQKETQEEVLRLKKWEEKIRDRTAAGEEAASAAQTAKGARLAHDMIEQTPGLDAAKKVANMHLTCLNGIMSLPELTEIVRFEQNLLTNHSLEGKLAFKDLEAQLLTLLKHPEVKSRSKLRLLLLFFLAAPEMVPLEKRAELINEAELNGAERTAALAPTWASEESWPTDDEKARRKTTHEPRAMRRGGDDDEYSLAQYWSARPRLPELMNLAAKGRLPLADFPKIRSEKTAPSAGKGPQRRRAANTQDLLVFVLGGVTAPEIRAAHQVARTHSCEVFVGGSTLVTPSSVLRCLLPAQSFANLPT